MNRSAEHSKLVAEILNEFGSGYGIRIWQQNTGAAKRGRAFIRFGVPGQADISGITADGRRVEIECKTGEGKRKKEQVRWGKMIEGMNGVYVLARSLEDVRSALECEPRC